MTAFLASFRSRAALQMEILALRHQLGVLQRSVNRPKLTPADRLLWAWLCAVWSDWRSGLFIVKISTAIGWHRKSFRLFWVSGVNYAFRRPQAAVANLAEFLENHLKTMVPILPN